ncbi:MAG: PKD domain-containing protein [Candidatus Nanohaloarchaea archaeon]
MEVEIGESKGLDSIGSVIGVVVAVLMILFIISAIGSQFDPLTKKASKLDDQYTDGKDSVAGELREARKKFSGGGAGTGGSGESSGSVTISFDINKNGDKYTVKATASGQVSLASASLYKGTTNFGNADCGDQKECSVTAESANLQPGEKVRARFTAGGGDYYEETKSVPDLSGGSSGLKADFRVTPSNPEVGEKVTFDAESSSAPSGGSIDEYKWEWTGDETFEGGGKKVNHKFENSGDKKVTLKVVASGGNDKTTKTVKVVSPSSGGSSTGCGSDEETFIKCAPENLRVQFDKSFDECIWDDDKYKNERYAGKPKNDVENAYNDQSKFGLMEGEGDTNEDGIANEYHETSSGLGSGEKVYVRCYEGDEKDTSVSVNTEMK